MQGKSLNMFSRYFVIFIFFGMGYGVQIPSRGNITILNTIEKHIILKSCNIAWTNSKSFPDLQKCDTAQPSASTALTRENSQAYLCMIYFDLNVKLCESLNKDTKLMAEMPKNITDIQAILASLDSSEIAKDFCNSSHNEMFNMSSDFSRTTEYVQQFVKAMSYKLGCEITCMDYNLKLNPFCKAILWMTKMLNPQKNKILVVDKLNQRRQEVVSGSIITNNSASANISNSGENNTNSGENKANKPVASASFDKSQADTKTDLHDDKKNLSGAASTKDMRISSGEIKEKISADKPIASVENSLKPSVTPSSIGYPIVEPDVSSHGKVSSTVSAGKNSLIEEAIDVNDGMDRFDEPDEDMVPDTKQQSQLDINEEAGLSDFNQRTQAKAPLSPGNDVDSASGVAGGVAPVEYTKNEVNGGGVTLVGKYEDSEDSHFFFFFLFFSGVLILGYILFHNKNKVLGLLLEGRRSDGRRRCPSGGPAYRKLDSTLEEVVNSAPPPHSPHVVY